MVVVLLALLAVGAFLWLRTADVFAVKRIVATGAERVTKEQLTQITAGVMGENLLALSTAELEMALRALPYVESAEVHRGFPDTLEIVLDEYRPVARLAAEGGALWVVSDSGRVLEGAQAADFPDLPLLVPEEALAVVAGEQVPAALAGVLPLADLLQSEDIRARLPQLGQIVVSAAGYAAVLLGGGGELRLGTPERLEQKLDVALDLVQQCLAQGRVIEYIDASVADRVAVKAK